MQESTKESKQGVTKVVGNSKFIESSQGTSLMLGLLYTMV